MDVLFAFAVQIRTLTAGRMQRFCNRSCPQAQSSAGPWSCRAPTQASAHKSNPHRTLSSTALLCIANPCHSRCLHGRSHASVSLQHNEMLQASFVKDLHLEYIHQTQVLLLHDFSLLLKGGDCLRAPLCLKGQLTIKIVADLTLSLNICMNVCKSALGSVSRKADQTGNKTGCEFCIL